MSVVMPDLQAALAMSDEAAMYKTLSQMTFRLSFD
jgi:hypothetical protein